MWKRYFIAGLLIWAPLGITFWVLQLIVGTLDQSLLLLPAKWHPDALLGIHIPGFGVVLSLLILLVTGMLAANFLGQRLVMWWEGLLQRIPVVRSIYSSVKQVSDTLLSSSGNSFRQAVLVEFPQRGQWTIAFLVGAPGPRVTQHLAPDVVTVYVPTAPNPTSGYTLIVPPSEIRELDISVDEALKFVISLGVVAPGSGDTRRVAGGTTTVFGNPKATAAPRAAVADADSPVADPAAAAASASGTARGRDPSNDR